jgi:regulator of protease activity HflC (stomatin/prohibitin superfamily)
MDKVKRINGKIPLIMGALLFVSFLGLNSYTVIESGKVGVLSTFGKYDPEELPPGLHLKIPLIQKIQRVDVRVHTITYKGRVDGPDKAGIINKPAITVLDKRGLPVEVELTVQYQLLPDMASEMLKEWGRNWEEKLINPTVREVVRDVIGQYPAELIPTKRPEITTKIENEIRKRIKEVGTIEGKPSVKVVGVQLRNILLPYEIQRKIKEVQIAKQEAEKMKYIEEKARREQEVRKIQAETRKIQMVIEAQAKAEAKLTEAKAMAEANKILSKSITPELLKWKELEVQHELVESLRKNPNTTLFINIPAGNFHMWLKENK